MVQDLETGKPLVEKLGYIGDQDEDLGGIL